MRKTKTLNNKDIKMQTINWEFVQPIPSKNSPYHVSVTYKSVKVKGKNQNYGIYFGQKCPMAYSDYFCIGFVKVGNEYSAYITSNDVSTVKFKAIRNNRSNGNYAIYDKKLAAALLKLVGIENPDGNNYRVSFDLKDVGDNYYKIINVEVLA